MMMLMMTADLVTMLGMTVIVTLIIMIMTWKKMMMMMVYSVSPEAAHG